MKRLLLLAALVGCTHTYANAETPAAPLADADNSAKIAETASVVSQMSMPNLPTELLFSQLGKSWRRFTVRNTDTASMSRMYGGSAPRYEQVLNEMGIGVHFTKGDNLTLGKETYLIAYRVDSGLDAQDMQQEIQQRLQALWGHGEQQPPARPAGKFSPRATLKLSLLNLRNLGDLQDLRVFDPKSDLLLPADMREMSNYNLRRLGQVLQQQSQWQPLPLRDTNALRQALRNQHMPVSLIRDPATNETYHLNTELAGKKVDSFGNRKKLVMIYEAAPSTDNTRGVLFADWHVERVPEWKWDQVRSAKPQKPGPQQLRVISASRMKMVFNYFRSFSRRGSNMNFKNSQTMRNYLMNNWGGTPQMYQSPFSGKWYLFNTKLSGMNFYSITNKNQVVAIYEPEVGSDGKRGAIFVDGIVRRIPEFRWNAALAVKPQSKSPATASQTKRTINNAV